MSDAEPSVASEPELSVACVVGCQRPRARKALDAIAAQTAADRIELVLVDLEPGAGALPPPSTLPVTVLERPGRTSFGEARAAALHAARAPVVLIALAALVHLASELDAARSGRGPPRAAGS